MSANDLIGVAIVLFVTASGLYGLSRLTKPYPSTKEEYEKRLKKGSGIAAGSLNALMYPFEEVLHPKVVEAVHVLKDVRQGYYDAQQEAGDGQGNTSVVPPQPGAHHVSAVTNNRRSRVYGMFRRVADLLRLGR